MNDEVYLLKLLEAEKAHQLRAKDNLWYAGNLRSFCHEAQHVIYDSFYRTKDKETVILAARRFGKSYLGLILCLEYCIRNPNTIARFVPPEIKQAWQICLPTMAKLEQSWPYGLVRYSPTEKAWKVGKDSWLYLGGFDSQNDAQRGGEAKFIVCDEAGFSCPETYDYILKSVLKPQLLTTRGRMLILSSPSLEPDHPFMQETVADAKLESRLHSFDVYQNPLLDKEQIREAMADCGGEDSEAWQREYLCKIVRPKSMMVLPRWDMNCVQEWNPEPWHYRCLVGDFGGVTDKTVIHIVAYDYRSSIDGTVWFLDERVYESNTTTNEIVAGIQALHNQWIKPSRAPDQDQNCYLDCPGQLKVDLVNHHGINVSIPQKDNFHAGVNLINLFVQRGNIKVHPRCKFTALSFENARFNDRRNDYIRNDVLGHCDAVASAIYGIRHVNRKDDGSPIPRANPENQAYWKQKYRPDNRQDVARAIFGGQAK